MSQERHQDLIYPPGPAAQRDQDKEGHRHKPELLTTTGRLFARFSLIRNDEEAILQILRQVPRTELLHARIALFQALGAQYTNAGARALALCERVFGSGTMYFPSERERGERKDLPSPEATPPSRAVAPEPTPEPTVEPEADFNEVRIQALWERALEGLSEPWKDMAAALSPQGGKAGADKLSRNALIPSPGYPLPAPAPRGAPLPTVFRDAIGESPITPAAVALIERALQELSEHLDPALRVRLEAMLGRSLDDVRIRRGPASDQAAHALGARAFTIGRDVFFRGGAYAPTSPDGVRLIAHEVTHTQQAESARAGGELRVSTPGDAAEREAHALADSFVGTLFDADRTRWAEGADHHGTDRARPTFTARHAAVSRQDDASGGEPTAPVAIPPGGEIIEQVGIVAWDHSPELRLRATPSTTGDNVLGRLLFNTHLQVIKRFPGDWLFVSTRDGRMGYVAASYIWFGPEHALPEPTARLHRVEAGVPGTAIAIAERYYRDVASDWGQDLRFYVNVLAAVNHLTVPSSVDGWRSVQFQAGQFIWIPSVQFSRSMRGQISSGSYTYETADAIAGAFERVGELMADFGTAIALSLQYIPEAVLRHAEEAIVSILQSLLLLAVGAVAILAISTAIGAAIGALAGGVGAAPGAAVGFEVGMALIEWIGLGFLVAWIGSSIARIGAAFAAFIETVWTARGNRAVLELAAWQFADALGVLIGVLIEAIVMWAVGQGVTRAVAALRNTAIGRVFGETRLGSWLAERIARYNSGETAVPGPREVMLRHQAREVASRMGLTESEALALLRALDPATIQGLYDQFGIEGMRSLASRPPEVLEAFGQALRITGADPVARASLMEGVRLNQRGTLSNAVFQEALTAYTRFRATYGDRVSGDFMSRFWRSLARRMDPRQAEAEIRLAEDLLAGRTPIREVGHLEGLPESPVPGGRVPEYRATTPEGARLVENKAIGDPNQPLTRTSVGNNARSANDQIHGQAERTGEAEGGLIRLDGRDTAPTDVTPETLAEWVSKRIPNPRQSRVTSWVEIFYRNNGGQIVRVVLELEGPRFVLRMSEVVPS